MIDLSLFFTPTLQGAKPQSALTAPVALQGQGLLAEAGGGDFMAMFLDGLTTNDQPQGDDQTKILSTVFLTKKTSEQSASDDVAIQARALLDSLTQEQIDQHGDPLFGLPPEILALLKDDGVVENSADDSKTGLLDLLHQIAAQGTLLEPTAKDKQKTTESVQEITPVSSPKQSAVEKFLAALTHIANENKSPDSLAVKPETLEVVSLDVPQTIKKDGKQKVDLSWLTLASLQTPEPQNNVQQIPFDTLPVETQKSIITTLNDMLKSLLAGTPDVVSENPKTEIVILGEVKNLVSDQNKSVESVDVENNAQVLKETTKFITPKETVTDQSPTFIVTNLTPQKLTEAIDALVKKFTADKKAQQIDDGSEQQNPLLALLVQILPPPQKGETVLTPPTNAPLATDITSDPKTIPVLGNNESMDDMAARLNDLVVGSSDLPMDTSASEEKELPLRGFSRVLEMLEQNIGKHDDAPQGLGKALDNVKTYIIDSSNMPKQNGATQNLITMSMLQQSTAQNDTGATMSQPVGFTTAPLTGAVPAANMALQAPQAGQPHPATQMVAATIAKNAKDGETKAMTLHLDPPELGRLQVKMEFGRDKTVKAHLVIEKPETYMMLQRDAQVLERILQQSGFDVDSGGVSFELSQGGGNLFDHNDRNQGNGNTYGSGDTIFDDDGLEIIETTVNWQVDSATGQTHYDLWA